MSRTHPALHPPGGAHATRLAPMGSEAEKHFVPIGWEEADRGVCPCGELVRWDVDAQAWVADRSLVLLVLTASEARHLRDDALYIEDLEPMLDLQLALNEEVDVSIVPSYAAQEAHPDDALELDTETRHLRQQESHR